MGDPKLSSVRALIFDLDGTLIDSKQDLIHSVNAMLRELGRGELAEETISGYIGHGAPKLVARALGDGSSEEERQRALQFFLHYYEQHKMDTTRTYPGVAETLEKLSNVPMAVLTNKPVRISVRILDTMGLSKYFRSIYGGNSFETKKPHPLGARTILRELSAEPHETLLVGDSEVDVQTARNANTWACGVTYGLGSERLVQHPPDVLLDSLTELPPLLSGAKIK